MDARLVRVLSFWCRGNRTPAREPDVMSRALAPEVVVVLAEMVLQANAEVR